MGELGELFGILIIVFYSLAVLNFCFKFFNRKYRDKLKRNEKFYKVYMNFLKFFAKYHRYFGFATILMILIHFFIQFSNYGLSITGCIAAGVMLLQIVLGIYGQFSKKKMKSWILIHRGIAVLLLVTILIHII
ncbi:MAG: hypothetical protein H6Q59_3494 [Firmicutes bacterium]|nr:hypothetical protein [Bacillota bacterium]